MFYILKGKALDKQWGYSFILLRLIKLKIFKNK